jgi:hypothetical protein
MSLNLKEYWNNRDAFVGEPPFDWIEDIVEHINPKSTIEIGCGAGIWSKHFNNYRGYDFAKKRIEGIPNCYYGDIIKGIDDRAELVFINAVLLHIPHKDIQKAIENIRKMSEKYIIMIEPITFRLQRKADHVFYHNYMHLMPELIVWRTIQYSEEDLGVFVKLA